MVLQVVLHWQGRLQHGLELAGGLAVHEERVPEPDIILQEVWKIICVIPFLSQSQTSLEGRLFNLTLTFFGIEMYPAVTTGTVFIVLF